MINKFCLFISVLALMAGCATTPQIPLTRQVQANIQSADVVLLIPQDRLNVTVSETNLGNPGLIFVLMEAYVDSARQSAAEAAASPITQQLQSYDFRSVMLNALSAETEKTGMIIFNKPIRLDTIESEACKRSDFDQSSAGLVMFTTIGYRLESGCLIITAVVEMYPKSEALLKFRHKPNNSNPMDIGNVIYRKTFTFSKEFITERNIKHNLSEGATSISKQIIDDLNSPL